MLKAYLNSSPAMKKWDEWHIPFGDKMPPDLDDTTKLKVATARAARTSYLTMDGQIDVAKDVDLHDKLAESGHFSPFEHSANAQPGNHGNFKGWKQYRKVLPNDERRGDLNQLLNDYERNITNK